MTPEMKYLSNKLRSIFKTWRKKQQQPSLTSFQYLTQLVGKGFELDNNFVEEHLICGVYKSEINYRSGSSGSWAECLSARYSRRNSKVDTVRGSVINYYHKHDTERLDILMINNNYVIPEERTSMGRIRTVYTITLNRFCKLLVDSDTLKYDKKKIRLIA